MKKILMIGVGWEQIPLIIKAKERGLYVIATTWWNEQTIPADKVYRAESRELEKLEEILMLERPDYILADECDYSMYAVAYFSEKYNYPGPKLAAQTITNNKFLQREYAKKSGVLQPEYMLCWEIEMAMRFAKKIGYPIMIKPVDNRGSIGVSKVNNEKNFLEKWLIAIANSHSRMCIVEKCIEGKVITSEGFADSKNFKYIASSNKDMYLENENLAKVLYYPGHFSKELEDNIKRSTLDIVKSIGISFGFTHIEFIIEENTENLYFIEAANRGGGVFISNIILENITGIDYAAALIDLSMGMTVDLGCIQSYIKKAIVYYLELNGNISIKDYEAENSNYCKALFTNKYRADANVKSEAAMGRHGVAILAGNSFNQLILEGRKIDTLYCRDSEDFIFVK